MPAALQTAIWFRRAQWMQDQCAARFGDTFTLRILNEGRWVVISHPDHVKQVFTGDPHVFHAKAVLFATGGYGRVFKITSSALAMPGPVMLANTTKGEVALVVFMVSTATAAAGSENVCCVPAVTAPGKSGNDTP